MELARLRRPRRVGWALLALLVLGTAAPASARRPRAPSDVRYEERYREILEEFAAGRSDEALEALARLDDEVLARDLREPYRALEREKLDVARGLAKEEPASALAVGSLHERAYTRHLDEGRYHLAAHARLVTEAMAGLLVRQGGEQGRARAALLMVRLGGRTHEAHQWSAAEDLYSDALLLDPRIEPAWLGLATIQEKRGSYRSAVASLRALEALPESPPEATLRLGVNLLRIGQREEGRRLLTEVSRTPFRPVWVRSVAFQELAGEAMDRGATGEAEALLREARRELPCDVGIAIQLAFVEERTGSAERAPGEPRLPACVASDLTSRSRYNRFSDEVFTNLDATLDDAVDEARPRLAEALRKKRRFPW